jgi:hypothetical protein
MFFFSYSVVHDPIRQASVKTQCPLCHAESALGLEFRQMVFNYSGAVVRTKNTSCVVFCRRCSNEIPESKWSKEIQLAVTEIKNTTSVTRQHTFTRRFWWVMGIGFGSVALLLIVALTGGFYSAREGARQKQLFQSVVSDPRVNDKLVVTHLTNGQIRNEVYRVIEVNESTLTVVASAQTNDSPVGALGDFDLSDSVFTQKPIVVVKRGLVQYQNWVEVGHEKEPVFSVVHAAGRPEP